MNAVRLPLNINHFLGSPGNLQALAEIVQTANQLDLIVILEAYEPGATLPSLDVARFWRECAAIFKHYPGVIFELHSGSGSSAPDRDPSGTAEGGRRSVDMQTLIEAVRSTGASQLVIVTTLPSRAAFGGIGPAHRRDDANVILSLPPPRRTGRSDRDWRRQLGSLADRAPVITAGWGLEPASDSEGCAAIPGDPSAAEAVVKANLTYFDTRKILGPPQFSSPGG